MITPKITNLGYSNLWTDMSTILGYASNFDQQIKKLFANGEQGFFYDPNDLSTMYQDANGTVPVTGTGQPVGLIRDKSGNNNHAFQTTSASRPILRKNAVTGANYLEFDGVDDFLVTNSTDFTSTDKISLFAGVRKLSDSLQAIAETGGEDMNRAGTFYLLSGGGFVNSNGYASISFGTEVGENEDKIAYTTTYPAPDDAVLSVKHDISNSLSSIRRNSVVGVDGIGDKGTGNFSNHPLHVGAVSGYDNCFNGHIYGLIGVGKLVSDNETTAIENELAKQVGVTIHV